MRVPAGADPRGVTKRESASSAAGPPSFGLPEHSALTVEGRIERASGVASHVTGARDGRERPLRSSNWMGGLWLIAAAFGLLVALMVGLYFIG